MKSQMVKDLVVGSDVGGVFYLKDCIVKTTSKGDPYADLKLLDLSGEIDAKLWQATKEAQDILKTAQYANVTGKVESFNNKLQVKISEFEPISSETIDLSDFRPTAPIPYNALKNRLETLIASVRDSRLSGLLHCVFDDPIIQRYLELTPAAQGRHHAYTSGLLQHTLEVTDLAAAVCDVQNNWGRRRVWRDLVVTATLLHDIGKVKELEWKGPEIVYSRQGEMLGHILLGYQYIRGCIGKLKNAGTPFPEELCDCLMHAIIAHHGRGEFGAPVVPKTPEALVVHHADLLDVQLFYMDLDCEGADEGEFVWSKYMEGAPRYASRRVFTRELSRSLDFTGTKETAPEFKTVNKLLPELRFVRPNPSAEVPSFETRRRPLIGQIAAGIPIHAEANIEEQLDVETHPDFRLEDEGYILRVEGDSMIGDRIHNGDLVAVRAQEHYRDDDIVVVLVEKEDATIKRMRTNNDGSVTLIPSNPLNEEIIMDDPSTIKRQGRVIGVLKEYKI